MEKYRKSDEYYNDEYDRRTIEDLKQKEVEMMHAYKIWQEAEDTYRDKLMKRYLGLEMSYNNDGVEWARNKRAALRDRASADERRDDVMKKAARPSNVVCRSCQGEMDFEFADFMGAQDEILFFFSCPLGHSPRRAFYADGRGYYTPERTCGYCNGKFRSKKKKSSEKLTFTNTCMECGRVETVELELKKTKLLPVNEDERKKYCTDFIGRRTFLEDLKALADLELPARELLEKGGHLGTQVQQVNIAMLEKILGDEIEKSDFIKLQFEKPKTGRYLTVEFSVQDPTDRESSKSVKDLKKMITTILFPTNWRLMDPGISCTLGYLSGQLKGYSLDEDLRKLAKEIIESSTKSEKDT